MPNYRNRSCILKDLLKAYTILYIEDELSIQKNMAEYLQEYFKKIYVASNGKEGLDKYHKYSPDVLLLDINLPQMDGLTLAKTIRKLDKKISIIMLTAFTDQEKLLKATELKLLKYLVKPIDLLTFQKTLDLLAEELSLTSSNILNLGQGYIWEKDTQMLRYHGALVPLTAKEHILLTLFTMHKNQSISFEEIMAHVWADEFDREISINCVKNIVSGLRKKLPSNTIKSVYGKGYMLQ
jgi:DNA-binding response OmpR family regulator